MGLVGSSFGLATPWALAWIALVAGLVAGCFRPRSRLLLWIALGLALGAIAYLLLGVALGSFGAPPTGAGSS